MFTDAEVDDFISEVLSETQWDEETIAVPKFLAEFTSAQPVRLVPQGRELDLGEADLLHPFLAFSRRRRTKVYAENLVWDSIVKKYMPKGPPLEIPKDYLGWFELVQQGQPMDQTCQKTIGDVVNTKCKQFLLRTTVVGYLASDNNNGDGEFQIGEEVRVYPGEILQIKDVIVKKWKTQSVDSGEMPNKKKSPVAETKFAECLDTKNRYVYLPFAHPGQFFGLWSSDMKGSRSPRMDLAYYIYDMLNFGFPFLVKVVFGWPPTDFPEFSGFLRILGLNRPDSLILRSMKPGSCVILELPMDADVKIEKMSNPDYLTNNRTFERVLAHSCDRIYPYLIGMKHMDTRYPVVLLPSSAPDSNKDNKSKDACRMARPRNMNTFNPMDIFPPLDEPIRKVSDSWTLSFKDPDFQSDPLSALRESESVIMNPQTEQVDKQKMFAGSRQESITGRMQGMRMDDRKPMLSGSKRHEEIWHKRGDMEQVFMEREADC